MGSEMCIRDRHHKEHNCIVRGARRPCAHVIVAVDAFLWRCDASARHCVVRVDLRQRHEARRCHCGRVSLHLSPVEVEKWPISPAARTTMRLWARAFHGSCAALAKRRATPALLPPGWEAVIGIECHAQLSGATKLFSGTSLGTQLTRSDAAAGAAHAAQYARCAI